MGRTKIEWADTVWNPVTGCSKVSEGCQNCYAERMAKRLAGRCGYLADEPFRVTVHPERLEEPLRWRKPRRVFVCSMGDLFHRNVEPLFISRVFDTMAACRDSTFMLLTKRPHDAKVVIDDEIPFWAGESFPGDSALSQALEFNDWPLPNVWLGVSVEDQRAADLRIPVLLKTPAAVRFVSYEPALGPVDWSQWVFSAEIIHRYDEIMARFKEKQPPPGSIGRPVRLDWVIAGGETGPGARPAHTDWFRSVRDQCWAAGVPFFFKHFGEWVSYDSGTHQAIGENWRDKKTLHDNIAFVHPSGMTGVLWKDSDTLARVGRKTAGRLLDGRTWDEFPEVRE